uniref:Pescadillo homolog n=1 Tax=Panagrolaimus sp. JU765 TaxID=591449 RepID=A0AC34Q5V0_9BILA
MGRPKRKYEVGMAATYMSRTAALKKLQMTLKDFQRLCILKGIYPREPPVIKKANKGKMQNRIFYHVADIKFLANEPLIQHFRDTKKFFAKLTNAQDKKEDGRLEKLLTEQRPVATEYLNRIVVERFPTFAQALRDLDDGLNLLSAFALLPAGSITRSDILDDCKRLTTEFYQYVIHAQCLTKAFVSIKGTYFQAQIMGEKITWIVGHHHNPGTLQNVDLRTMGTFVDFYITALKFINFRLYTKLGLHYPPKLAKSKAILSSNDEEETVYCLAHELEGTIDTLPTDVFCEGDDDGSNTADKLKQLEMVRHLFNGKRFFINRECPKDILTLVIRNCGGVVSWEGCPNAKFNEDYEGINYHIIDRPIVNFKMNRIYVQPQWIFDSFNFRKLLPTNKYAPGATLPPHLSPFILESDADYIPPERLDMLRELGHEPPKAPKTKVMPVQTAAMKIKKKPNKVVVKEGAVYNQKKQELIDAVQFMNSRKKLQEMMIPKKHKTLYKKMQFTIKSKAKEKRALENKRKEMETKK